MTGLDDLGTMEDVVTHLRQRVRANAVLATRLTPSGQLILANNGLYLPPHLTPLMPFEYSICQHVVAMDFPLLVDNAHTHPLLTRSGAVREFGLAAYVGVPIHDATGRPVGAVCALQFQLWRWEKDDLRLMMSGAERLETMMRRVH